MLLDPSEAGRSCSHAKNAEVTSPKNQPQASRWDGASRPDERPEEYGFRENTGKIRTHHPGNVSKTLDNLQVAPHKPRHPESRFPPAYASGTPGEPSPAPLTHLDVSGERGRGPEKRQEEQQRGAHRRRHHPPPPERNCVRSVPAGTRLARPRLCLEWQPHAPIERRQIAAPPQRYQPMGRGARQVKPPPGGKWLPGRTGAVGPQLRLGRGWAGRPPHIRLLQKPASGGPPHRGAERAPSGTKQIYQVQLQIPQIFHTCVEHLLAPF